MNRFAYSLILHAALPLIVARMVWRSLKAPAYRRRLKERLGYGPATPGGIWIHAVSLGETIAVAPLVRRLLAEHPGVPVTITTTTPTGSERVKSLFGDRVTHSYVPWDLPWAVKRYLARSQPRLVLLMETELWPNLIAACRQRDIPVMLINARLSARSARGYRRLGGLTSGMLQSLSLVAAQHEADGERLVALGLPPDKLRVTGSIKYDQPLDDDARARAEAFRHSWTGEGRPVWIAASTHAGEDEIALEAHRAALARYPELLLVLVPRHPERFDAVTQLASQRGFAVRRRTAGAPEADTQVLVGDTLGELLSLYGASDIAFVGGSLVDVGGHNLLEPAVWGIPVLSGPQLFNFRDIADQLQEGGGLELVRDADSLAAAVIRLLGNPQERERRGRAASAVVEAGQGALDQLCRLVAAIVS